MGHALLSAVVASVAVAGLTGPGCTRDAASDAAPPAPQASSASPAPSSASPPSASGRAHPAPGKYGCTSSHFVAASGTYEYRPRGSIVVEADGSYSYLGLATPSRGTASVDAKGAWHFVGGYLAGGEATPLEGRPKEVLLVAPALDTRWKCGKVD